MNFFLYLKITKDFEKKYYEPFHVNKLNGHSQYEMMRIIYINWGNGMKRQLKIVNSKQTSFGSDFITIVLTRNFNYFQDEEEAQDLL